MGKLDMSVVAHLFLWEVLYYSVLPRAKGGGHAAELYLSEKVCECVEWWSQVVWLIERLF